jgi:O-acetyl-ADP-ribose deacetylase (regulator of RNase III)
LEIVFGNIAEQEVDAVVSADDAYLSMDGGVSGTLLRVAGPDLSDLCKRIEPVRIGRAVVTPGFELPAKFVFHGITMAFEGEVTKPSRDIIREIVDACFFQAECYAVESLAFPLLGTGAGRFPKDVGLDTMFRTIAKRLLRQATPVKRVRIVLRAAK